MSFKERLSKYRDSLMLNKKEMAAKLGFIESYYNMIENGKREPSKKFLIALVADSGKPEEYWLYGIDENEYIETRDRVKSTKIAMEQILELNLIDDLDSLFKNYKTDNVAEILLIAAMKSDFSYMIQPKKKDE